MIDLKFRTQKEIGWEKQKKNGIVQPPSKINMSSGLGGKKGNQIV